MLAFAEVDDLRFLFPNIIKITVSFRQRPFVGLRVIADRHAPAVGRNVAASDKSVRDRRDRYIGHLFDWSYAAIENRLPYTINAGRPGHTFCHDINIRRPWVD